MSYQTFRIDTVPSSTNTHTTGRMETWTLLPDVCFNDFENAQNYVIVQNLIHSELSRFLGDFNNEDDKNAFRLQFCFGENHLHLQRYFLGQPDVEKIKQSLKENGIDCI